MVSVILANRLFYQCIKAVVLSNLLHCQFEGELKMHFLIQIFFVITGEFFRHKREICLPLLIFFEHCLDVVTISLSSTTKAFNRSCLLANNPLDFRFNL